MALTIECDATEALSLDDYIELVDRWVDPDDLDSLRDSAIWLKRLANNRRFLIDHVNERLRRWASIAPTGAGDTSFELARRRQLFVRANVWIPPREMPKSRVWEANVLAYLVPHDHCFSFLTVGYLGPGYETVIYEYERGRPVLRPGDKVELREIERTSLSAGKIMLYEACKDIHRQSHPRQFSISLNLVTFPSVPQDQYIFDGTRSRLLFRANDYRHTQKVFCRIAKYLGGPATVSVLQEVACSGLDDEVRAEAFSAWAELSNGRAIDVWRQALNDKHEYVRTKALEEVSRLDEPK